jgi:hypothetical protein
MKKIFIILIISSLSLHAQQEKDSVSTEVINVVTSYKPTISDAFKANETPSIEISKKDKATIRYNIKSKPIKSVFKPYSGSYKKTPNIYSKPGYPDYLKVGYGNFGTPLVESFLHKRKDAHEGQIFLYNRASNGGIKNNILNDNFLKTEISLNYKNHKNTQKWEVGAVYKRDLINWYGTPYKSISYQEDVLHSIDEKQTYNHFLLQGSIALNQEWIEKSEARIEKFTDRLNSSESRFYFSPTFSIPLNEQKIKTKVILDILHGEFVNDYSQTKSINYGYLNFGAEANYPITRDNLSISLGAKLIYNSDLENKKGRIFIYPDIHANVTILNELLYAYGEFTGEVIQNSYQSITRVNPYVSPTLDIKPTSNTFKILAGFKGKITSTIHYNLNASYAQEKDKLLFQSNKNLTDGTNLVSNGYEAGNSFYVLYDNMKTLSLYGNLSASINKNIETGISLSLYSYSMKNETESWNLPPYIATGFVTYAYGKWNSKAEILSKGKRKDLLKDYNNLETIKELNAYVDLNLSTHYKFNRRWSAFLELNNVLNSNYEMYSNFRVQGFQVLGGGVYHFDF